MKVLVTGASGLLGAGVARALADRGEVVTVLQRRPSELGLTEVRGDVADSAVVARAVAGQDAVIHLAAKVNVVGPWSEYERINIGGTRTLVDACRRAGVSRFVQVSSPSVAHTGQSIVGAGAGPADPDGARSPYARSKAVAEQIALAADGPDLAVLAVRPHLVWGPGDTQLVARIVARARAGRLPIIGSGGPLVDTTYVTNAVGALVCALDAAPTAHGAAYVVTNGEPRPIAEILSRLAMAGGAAVPRLRVPVGLASAVGFLAESLWARKSLWARRSEHDQLEADPPITRFLVEQLSTAHWFEQRRTREALRWHPEVGLDDGFDRLTTWYADQPR